MPVIDLIKDSPVANADAPATVTLEFLATGRPRVGRELEDFATNPLDDTLRQVRELFRRGAADRDLVLSH